MKILVSACLLGENCKYSGGNNYNEAVAEFVKDKDVLPICPEMMAGMGCPRTPIEIVDGVLMDRNGNNVDVVMREAVEKAMEMIRKEDIQCAVLQSRSPTCGVNQIYDGSFSGKLIPGSGVLAQALKDAGYQVIDAENMMALLPTASRIGFTGTPLFANDAITQRTFGDYISVYDFKRAVEDGATVPLYYENRGEKLGTIKNPDITQEILDAIEAAELDVSQQEKLEREFAKEIHILTAQPRLDAIAKDFVEHYTDVWTSGKAMFVCLNKVTCVRMYNLVQSHWAEKIRATEAALKHTKSQQEYQELERKLQWMKETEMAVVISSEQN